MGVLALEAECQLVSFAQAASAGAAVLPGACNDNLFTHRPTLSIRATLKALLKVLGRHPVAQILLVEAQLAAAGRISFQWPVARRIGCKRLVDEDEPAVVDESKLELGVCDDESAHCCMVRRGGVQSQRDIRNLVV